MSGTDGGGDGVDGNQPTLREILERMRKLEQDLTVERALRQMANPGGTGVPSRASVNLQIRDVLRKYTSSTLSLINVTVRVCGTGN
jgi:hypothetical protein